MKLRYLPFALLGLLAAAPLRPVSAQVQPAPALMNFQGRLAKPDGTPVSDGTYSIQFSLYDAVTAGNQKWTQTVSSVSVRNGSFAVLLSGFPAGAFNGNLWLQIQIGTAAALTPRQQMVSVAYAMKANSVPDGSIGLTQLAAGVIPTTLPPGGAAGGDLSGTYPNPLLAVLSGSLTKVSGNNLFVSGSLIADKLGLLVDSAGLNAGALTNGSPYGLIFGSTGSGEGIASARTGSANLDGLDFYTDYIKRMSVTNTGNVGIGTAAPAYLLDVAGTARVTGFLLPTGAAAGKILTSDASGNGTWQTAPAGGATGAAGGDLTGIYPNPMIAASAVNNGKLALDAFSLNKVSGGVMASVGGNIGIGYANPQQLLSVAGSITTDAGATNAGYLNRVPNGTNSAAGYGLVLGGGGEGLASARTSGSPNQNGIDFFTNFTNRVSITNTGNVGIGTTAPSTLLQVNGEITANVVTVLGGSDVAEPYEVASAGATKPIPGCVVTIDPDHIGQMRVASRAYDPTVAGIISGANGIAPGITLRQKGTVADGSLPVASIGRVWCLCDADAGGPIAPGDMLTTSDTPGHAMKATDRERRDGAVIGKAMSPLKAGRGMVLVLVSLK